MTNAANTTARKTLGFLIANHHPEGGRPAFYKGDGSITYRRSEAFLHKTPEQAREHAAAFAKTTTGRVQIVRLVHAFA